MYMEKKSHINAYFHAMNSNETYMHTIDPAANILLNEIGFIALGSATIHFHSVFVVK